MLARQELRQQKWRELVAPFIEAPRSAFGENAPSRAVWRVLGQGLSGENSRFSMKTVAELRKMFWLSVSGRVFVSDALVLTPTLYFNKRSLLSDSTFDSVARPA